MDPSPTIPSVEITVVDVVGSGPREPGARMHWRPGGQIIGTIGGGNLEMQALAEAEKLWRDPDRRAAFLEYPLSAKLGQCCGGLVRLSLIKRLPPREALICGAGHVGAALARVISDTPLRVSIVDPRDAFADPKLFPAAVRVVADDPEAFARDWAAELGRAERTYLFIITHDHPLDESLCRLALRHPFLWIGLIGSRTKWLRFRQRLAARGFSPEEIARIHCPIGDPALGRSPQEIAIGAAAQVLAHFHGAGNAEKVAPASDAADRAPGPRAALVLAGGASSRMGRWKGGLDFQGEPLIAAHARAFESAGAEIWKAVYPATAQSDAEKVVGAGHRVMNPAPEAAMFASLQLGVRELVRERPDLASILVTPVDLPPIEAGLVAALWDRHESTGAWVTRPYVTEEAEGKKIERHGHPIVLDQRMLAPILAADPATARLDFLVRDLPEEAKISFELPDPSIFLNLNTPEDYAKAIG